MILVMKLLAFTTCKIQLAISQFFAPKISETSGSDCGASVSPLPIHCQALPLQKSKLWSLTDSSHAIEMCVDSSSNAIGNYFNAINTLSDRIMIFCVNFGGQVVVLTFNRMILVCMLVCKFVSLYAIW